MAPGLALLDELPGFAHLAELSGPVDQNEVTVAAHLAVPFPPPPCLCVLVALLNAFVYALLALAVPGVLQDERLALQDEARLDVLQGAPRLGVQDGP